MLATHPTGNPKLRRNLRHSELNVKMKVGGNHCEVVVKAELASGITDENRRKHGENRYESRGGVGVTN
jgi:hypothetical protein